MSSPFTVMQHDVERLGIACSEADWKRAIEPLREVHFQESQVLFESGGPLRGWIFVTRGLTVLQQVGTVTGGKPTIDVVRFYEAGQLCPSPLPPPAGDLLTRQSVLGITDGAGILIHERSFNSIYAKGGWLGTYLRIKMMDAMAFDRAVMSVKTAMDLELRYRFLERFHVDLLSRTQEAFIARFLGLTRESYQTWLQRRSGGAA